MKMKLKHILYFILFSFSHTSFSQCAGSEPILFLGNDTTVCQMNPRVLTAPTGYTYYNWSTGAITPSITVTTPGTYSVEVVVISDTNKVVNGGFESGNTNFTSGYILGSGNPGYGPLTNEGTYQVTTNPSLVHSLFTSYPFDHSVPGTKMFVANGSFVPGTVIWSQTVAVTPGQDYALSAWFMNVLTTVNVANLQFYINGVPLGNIFSTNVTGNIWEQFYAVWNSGTSTSAVLSVVNQNVNNVGGGNDFAMDDILFAPVCKKIDTITISLASAPTQTIATVGSSNCTGSPNGSITITSPTAVSYSFDNGSTWQASNVKLNLAPGNYTVMSKDLVGCFASTDCNLTSLVALPTISTSIINPVLCAGAANGEITINSATAVLYSFDNGLNWQATNTQNGFAIGTYVVMVKDVFGCENTETVVFVGTPVAMTLNISPDVSICQNGTTTLTALATGGTSFIYHWDDFASTAASQNVAANSASAYYVVHAENQDGCLSDKDSILVTVFSPITAIVSAPVVLCSGASFNLAATNVIGGKAPYTYLWTIGATTAGTLSTISVIATTDVVYTVTIKDACESTPVILTTSVSIVPFAVPAFQIDNISMCEPGVFNLLNTMDPSLVMSSLWEISSGARFTDQNSISLSDVQFGSYDVNLIVTNTSGCVASYELINAFEVFANPVANFNVSASTITSLDPTVHFTNWSSGAVSYTWNIESGSPSTSMNEHVISQFPIGVESSYTVELIAESANQCVDTMTKVITVVPEPLMFVPNTFTPGNADQVNQTWKPIFSGFDLERGYEVMVFNRWGEILWNTKDVSASWDGIYKGERVSCGAYSYAIVTKDTVTDKKFYFNGHVNVLK